MMYRPAEKYYLGIDIGTSSVKALLVDTKGRAASGAQEEYEIRRPKAMYAEQDMDEIWAAVRKTIRAVMAKRPELAGSIGGVSYSGQMHGLVMTDRDGNLIRDAIIWCDQRAASQIQSIYESIGRERIRAVVRNELSTGFLISSLLWVRENEPENYEKIHKVMLPKDYIRFKMCGEIGTDYSDASATAIYDTGKNEWSWELIGELKLEKSFFPACHGSSEIAGVITEECAEKTGLKKGTPVTYGGGDSIMQQAGNGVFDERSPWIANIGTGCSLNCVSGSALCDSQYRINIFSHLVPERWMLMGAALSGGVILKWLKNQIFGYGNYDSMTAEAASVPAGSEGLFLLPYLDGARCPVNDSQASGIWAGLTLKHTRAHMIRSAMEGIVYSMKVPFQIFEELGLRTERVIASGGGARGELFLQIEADMFDREIRKTAENEQSCLGAAITAAVGTGCYGSFEEACGRMVRYEDSVTVPRKENVKIYEEGYQRYLELYPNNREWFHKDAGRVSQRS